MRVRESNRLQQTCMGADTELNTKVVTLQHCFEGSIGRLLRMKVKAARPDPIKLITMHSPIYLLPALSPE